MSDLIYKISTFLLFSSVAVPFIIEFIFLKIKEPQTTLWRSIWSWIIPIVASYAVWGVGMIFEVGFLVGVEEIWVPLIYGAVAAMFSNFAWTNICWIKEFIYQILERLPGRKV